MSSWRASSSPDSYHFFYGHTPSARNPIHLCVFSQWYDCPFVVDGISYATAEHYMMYAKARLFGDSDTATQILECSSPRDAKALGRRVANFDQGVWDAHADHIVETANYHKFSGDLWDILNGTGTKILVEAAARDRIWGIGYAAERAMENRARWGTNRLGLALVRVREQIRRERAL